MFEYQCDLSKKKKKKNNVIGIYIYIYSIEEALSILSFSVRKCSHNILTFIPPEWRNMAIILSSCECKFPENIVYNDLMFEEIIFDPTRIYRVLESTEIFVSFPSRSNRTQ